MLGPQLTELKLMFWDWNTPPPVLLNLDKFVWRTNITVLNLSGMLVAHALQLLLACTNLVEYLFYQPRYGFSPEDFFRPNVPVTLCHLKRLEWGVYREEYWSEFALQHVRAPALQYFIWVSRAHHITTEHWENIHDFYRDLGYFLSATSTTLIEIEICFPLLPDSMVLDLAPTIVACASNTCSLTLSAEGIDVSLPRRINLFLSLIRGVPGQSSAPLPCLTYLRFVSRSCKGRIQRLFAPASGEVRWALISRQEITRERRELFGVASFVVKLDFDHAWDFEKHSFLKQLLREFIIDAG